MTDKGFGKVLCFSFPYLLTRKKALGLNSQVLEEGILEGNGGTLGRGVPVCP